MSYTDLTDNQKLGIDYNAAHNCKTIEAYIQWRLEQDADRGYKERQDKINVGIPLPETWVEPEILVEPEIMPLEV